VRKKKQENKDLERLLKERWIAFIKTQLLTRLEE
jgi:hypothetical protein